MDGQYKLEDFGKIVGWNKDGTPFMAYRDNKKTDTQQEQTIDYLELWSTYVISVSVIWKYYLLLNYVLSVTRIHHMIRMWI